MHLCRLRRFYAGGKISTCCLVVVCIHVDADLKIDKRVHLRYKNQPAVENLIFVSHLILFLCGGICTQ